MTKILVIEDVHYLRDDVMEMLRFEGFDVRGAENGLVGVNVARDYMPDLIICDIMMPEMDGYQVLEELRGDIKTAAIPFIFLTAKTDRIDMRHGMGMGADDYLTKPFLSGELLETIHARLNNRKTMETISENKLNELRENITTALPHELRTPLNTIIGFSDMLIMEAQNLAPEQIVEWSQHINTAALRLYRLVENYLTYVRIETIARDHSRADAMRQHVVLDPATVIEFQAMHRAQQVERESDLVLHVHPTPTVAIADSDLSKIVDELVDNAFKFSEKGQPVTVKTAIDDEGRFVLTVTDHGRGMSEEQTQAVGAYMQFERWFYEQQGTGLGLAIVRRLAELHGGSMKLDSAKEKGTTVTVILPVAS